MKSLTPKSLTPKSLTPKSLIPKHLPLTRLAVALPLLFALAGTSACQSNPEEDQISSDLWAEIEGDTQGYRSFTQFEGVEAAFESGTHDGTVRVYVNDTVASALDAEWSGLLPDGAVLIKEAWNDAGDVGSTPRNITVMKKVAGFAPDSNDWFWANFNADGSVSAQGDVGMCRDCHAGGQANDYVLTADFAALQQ